MKIYTRTGDAGETGLFAGPRVTKDDTRIEAYGSIDELNAAIGWARCELSGEWDALLAQIQHELFAIGAELATPDPAAHDTALVGDAHVHALEQAIDRVSKDLAPLRQFILPAGSRAVSGLHLARAICRRAERRLVTLATAPQMQMSPTLLGYVNRLSDLLFAMARAVTRSEGRDDVGWEKPAKAES
ncbi:MAG: ATP:cob(I)alamin adenosyltransferase [Planctomycetaceae bacterium]|nr:ATP:cob(I)alamin adenosyltransferase [Planctomycetaceae bacterium]